MYLFQPTPFSFSLALYFSSKEEPLFLAASTFSAIASAGNDIHKICVRSKQQQ